MRPTIAELQDCYFEKNDDNFTVVHRELVDTWRHGTEHEVVFNRKSDNTFWCIVYRTDKDGEYNDFRDNELTEADVFQVEPKTKTITIYEGV